MTSTEKVSAEYLAEMLAGLEGVTPGPWDEAAGLVRAIDGDVAIPIFETREPWKKHRRTSTVLKQEWHNRHHVARCDPDTIRSIITELQALRSTTSKSVSVAPLDWGKTSYGMPEVFSVTGVYRINNAMNGGWSVVAGIRVLRSSDGRTNFPSVEEAKAAAQLDYERKILSCLRSGPIGVNEVMGAINKLPRRGMETHDNNGNVFVSLKRVRQALAAAFSLREGK